MHVTLTIFHLWLLTQLSRLVMSSAVQAELVKLQQQATAEAVAATGTSAGGAPSTKSKARGKGAAAATAAARRGSQERIVEVRCGSVVMRQRKRHRQCIETAVPCLWRKGHLCAQLNAVTVVLGKPSTTCHLLCLKIPLVNPLLMLCMTPCSALCPDRPQAC